MKKFFIAVMTVIMILAQTGISNPVAAAERYYSNTTVANGTLEEQNPVLVNTDDEAKQLIKDFIAENITDNMTTVEKLSVIAQFVANYSYFTDVSQAGDVLISGYGDCGEMAALFNDLCEEAGFGTGTRDSSHDAGASNSHVNALAYDGNEVYILHATEGRTLNGVWSVEYCGSGFEYGNAEETNWNNEWIDGVYFRQYNGLETEINLNDGFNDVKDYWDNSATAVTHISREAMLRTTKSSKARRIIIPDTVVYVNDLYTTSDNIVYIFEGDAPQFCDGLIFYNTRAKVYYPSDNPTWTNDIINSTMEDLGEYGNVEWIPYHDIEETKPKVSIGELDISYSDKTIYNGSQQKPAVSVRHGNELLKENVDYSISYGSGNYTDAGNYIISVSGMGRYTDTADMKYTISKAEGKLVFAEEQIYRNDDDAPFTNNLKITGDGTVSYTSSDTDVAAVDSTGQVTIKGPGSSVITAALKEGKNYNGCTAEYNLNVSRNTISLDLCTVNTEENNYIYDGTAKTPSVTVKYGNTLLKKDTDYTVSYSDNTDAGTANIRITGAGKYTDSKDLTFEISKAPSSLKFENNEKTVSLSSRQFRNNLSVTGDGTVSYTSSDSSIAEVDKNGTVTLKAPGTVRINAELRGINYTDSSAGYILTVKKDIKTLTSADISISDNTVYNGTQQKPSISVTHDGKYLKENSDYTVSYGDGNYTDAGNYIIFVSGTGDYAGTIDLTYIITKSSYTPTAKDYNGTYDEQSHTITLSGVKSGSEIRYSTDNKNWSATVPSRKAIGTTTVYYQITNSNYNTITGSKKIVISKGSYTPTAKDYKGGYDGNSHTITLSGIKSGSTVKYRTSTKASWSATKPSRKAIGTTTVYYQITNSNYNTITGSKKIVISKGSYTPTAKDYNGTYNGKSHTITLSGIKSGSTVKYRTSTKASWSTKKPTRTSAGTTTVYYQITNSNYNTITGSKKIVISKKNVSKLTIKGVPTSKTYTGKQIKPSVTVYDGSKKLKKNTDYTVSYGSNKSAGKATIKITGKGNYAGSVTKTFYIKKAVSKLTIKGMPSTKTYTGKQIKPSITVYDGSKKLTNKTDYTVSYGTNKSTGKATVKITGKGNYTGSVTKTFYIVPAKVTLSSVTAGSKKATVKFKKVTGATGYQIAYKKDGASKWSTTTTTSASKTISKLTKGKKYSFKVRAYKTVSGVKKYGSYSSVMTVKIK